MAQVESQAEAEKIQGSRYNLRRRKDDGEAKAEKVEAEKKEAAAPEATPAAASPSPSLDFGGKIGRFLREALVCERVCLETPLIPSLSSRSLLLAALPARLGALRHPAGEPERPQPGQRPSPAAAPPHPVGPPGAGPGSPLGGLPGAALHPAHREGQCLSMVADLWKYVKPKYVNRKLLMKTAQL